MPVIMDVSTLYHPPHGRIFFYRCPAYEPDFPRSTSLTFSRLRLGQTKPAPAPRVTGKFFYVGDTKLYLRGATYGTFQPDAEGNQYGQPEQVEQDFRLMASSGINAVRLYTIPPRWLLDLAARHGIYLMVGVPWERRTRLSRHRQQQSRHREEGARRCACLCRPPGPPLLLYRQRNPGISCALVWASRG